MDVSLTRGRVTVDDFDRVRATTPATGHGFDCLRLDLRLLDRCSPARSKCQYSVVRRVRVTSKRVRLPQPAQRHRWASSGSASVTSAPSRGGRGKPIPRAVPGIVGARIYRPGQ